MGMVQNLSTYFSTLQKLDTMQRAIKMKSLHENSLYMYGKGTKSKYKFLYQNFKIKIYYRRRKLRNRPFDKDGNKCKNAFQRVFNPD